MILLLLKVQESGKVQDRYSVNALNEQEISLEGV
jgi:hypothetical protein